jgi:thioredoxin-like negative regulator of GroEL
MGFFDKLTGRKTPAPTPIPAAPIPAAEPAATAAGGLLPRLATARERLDAKDLPGALAIYDEVLAVAGDRADVLVTISGDLGMTGHVKEIIELVAPRYDADRHGPAIGLNVLQAYLAVRDPDAAQHVLDILFSLNRPELEERLHGFSNAIADLLAQDLPPLPGATGAPPAAAPDGPAKVDLISISKPIWFYGLEPLAGQILPENGGRPRRVAFAQLAVLGWPNVAVQMKQPEEEMGRLSRGIPLWLAETFYFSTHYAPLAAVGVLGRQRYAIFGAEWTTENLRQLVSSTEGGLDYIFTGALRRTADACEVIIRLWEVKKFRERKQFTARWTAATADAELAQLHGQICTFMEWAPAAGGLTYAAPAQPRAWLDTLAGSLSLFLAEKELLARDQLAPPDELLAPAAAGAASGEAASLAYLTSRNRAQRLELAGRLEAVLAASPLIAQASALAP